MPFLALSRQKVWPWFLTPRVIQCQIWRCQSKVHGYFQKSRTCRPTSYLSPFLRYFESKNCDLDLQPFKIMQVKPMCSTYKLRWVQHLKCCRSWHFTSKSMTLIFDPWRSHKVKSDGANRKSVGHTYKCSAGSNLASVIVFEIFWVKGLWPWPLTSQTHPKYSKCL